MKRYCPSSQGQNAEQPLTGSRKHRGSGWISGARTSCPSLRAPAWWGLHASSRLHEPGSQLHWKGKSRPSLPPPMMARRGNCWARKPPPWVPAGAQSPILVSKLQRVQNLNLQPQGHASLQATVALKGRPVRRRVWPEQDARELGKGRQEEVLAPAGRTLGSGGEDGEAHEVQSPHARDSRAALGHRQFYSACVVFVCLSV